MCYGRKCCGRKQLLVADWPDVNGVGQTRTATKFLLSQFYADTVEIYEADIHNASAIAHAVWCRRFSLNVVGLLTTETSQSSPDVAF